MTLPEDNVIEGLQNDDDSNSVFIFGTDVSKIPCFKDSFLTGIYGGVGCGIASFLTTSKVLRSANISVISFSLITLGYWVNCRMRWSRENFYARQSEDTFREEIESIKKKKQKKDLEKTNN